MLGGRFRRWLHLTFLWLCAFVALALLTVWLLNNWYDVGVTHSHATPTGPREHIARTNWFMFSRGRAVWCTSLGRWSYADGPESLFIPWWGPVRPGSDGSLDSWWIGVTPNGGLYAFGFGFDWIAHHAQFSLLEEKGWVVQAPLWFPALLFLTVSAIAMYRRRRLRYRLTKGLCGRCGFDLRATEHACSECGDTR